jgi:hypothetical protein
MEILQKQFMEEAKKIKRDGVHELLEYLKTTDFFTAPASVKYHNAIEGGLLEHSLAVYDIAHEFNKLFELELDENSVSICGLFHDVCKANFYTKEFKNKKVDDKWTKVEGWGYKDLFPMGHGEKSVYLVQQYIKLTDAEALAIRWHLGGFDPGTHFGYPSGIAMNQAMREQKLVSLIILADLASARLLEK